MAEVGKVEVKIGADANELKKSVEESIKLLNSFKTASEDLNKSIKNSNNGISESFKGFSEEVGKEVGKAKEEVDKFKDSLKDDVKFDGYKGNPFEPLGDGADKVKPKINGVKKALSEVDGLLGKLDGSLKNIQGKIQQVSSFAGKVITPFMLAGGAVLKMNDTFEQGRKVLKRTTDVGISGMKELEQSILNVRKAGLFTMEDVAVSVGGYNRNFGLTGKDLDVNALKTLQMAEMSGINPEQLLDTLSQSMRAWEIDQSQLSNFQDLIWKTYKATGTPIEKMLNELSMHSDPFIAAGFSPLETLSIVGNLHQRGAKGDLIMSSMRQIVQKFASEGITDSRREIEGIISLLEDKEEEEAVALVSKITSARSGVDVARSMIAGDFDIGETAKGIVENNSSIFDDYYESLTFFEKLKMELRTLEETFKPVVDNFMEALGNMMPYFYMMVEAVEEFSARVAEIETEQWEELFEAIFKVVKVLFFLKIASLAIEAVRIGILLLQGTIFILNLISVAFTGMGLAGLFASASLLPVILVVVAITVALYTLIWVIENFEETKLIFANWGAYVVRAFVKAKQTGLKAVRELVKGAIEIINVIPQVLGFEGISVDAVLKPFDSKIQQYEDDLIKYKAQQDEIQAKRNELKSERKAKKDNAAKDISNYKDIIKSKQEEIKKQYTDIKPDLSEFEINLVDQPALRQDIQDTGGLNPKTWDILNDNNKGKAKKPKAKKAKKPKTDKRMKELKRQQEEAERKREQALNKVINGVKSVRSEIRNQNSLFKQVKYSDLIGKPAALIMRDARLGLKANEKREEALERIRKRGANDIIMSELYGLSNDKLPDIIGLSQLPDNLFKEFLSIFDARERRIDRNEEKQFVINNNFEIRETESAQKTGREVFRKLEKKGINLYL